MQKATIIICPIGLPFATKIKAVMPITDETSEKTLLLSKSKYDPTINIIDKLHSNISKVVK
jgi:hypothetical protein